MAIEPTASRPSLARRTFDYIRGLGLLGGAVLLIGASLTFIGARTAYPWAAERTRGLLNYPRTGSFQYVDPRTHPYTKVSFVLSEMDPDTSNALERVCPIDEKKDIGVVLQNPQYRRTYYAILRTPDEKTLDTLRRQMEDGRRRRKRTLVDPEPSLLFDPSNRVCEVAGRKIWPFPWETYRVRVDG